MEHLLKLSGLLGDEGDQTDLGTLEKRLADQASSKQGTNGAGTPSRSPAHSDSTSQTGAGDGPDGYEKDQARESKGRTVSPPPPKRSQEEVEALSDMMCSLVTTNCGETRYIGRLATSVFRRTP